MEAGLHDLLSSGALTITRTRGPLGSIGDEEVELAARHFALLVLTDRLSPMALIRPRWLPIERRYFLVRAIEAAGGERPLSDYPRLDPLFGLIHQYFDALDDAFSRSRYVRTWWRIRSIEREDEELERAPLEVQRKMRIEARRERAERARAREEGS